MFNFACVILLYSLLHLAPKPFAEMSVMIRRSEHSDINQFKYVLLALNQLALSTALLSDLLICNLVYSLITLQKF